MSMAASTCFTTRLPARARTHIHQRPQCSARITTFICHAKAEQYQREQGPSQMAMRVMGAIAAAQLAMLPIAGVAMADDSLSGGSAVGGLSTTTKPEGLGAKIEASDITKESTDDILDKLKNKLLPEAKAMIAKTAEGTGSNYPSSIAKELETVENEVESQIQAVSSGSGDPSNLKSWLSGVEQQMNALKAIAGFD